MAFGLGLTIFSHPTLSNARGNRALAAGLLYATGLCRTLFAHGNEVSDCHKNKLQQNHIRKPSS
jgi:hypothetical protein